MLFWCDCGEKHRYLLNLGFPRTHSHELQTSFDKQVTWSAHPFHCRRIKCFKRTDSLHEHAARSLGSEQAQQGHFGASLIQVSMGVVVETDGTGTLEDRQRSSNYRSTIRRNHEEVFLGHSLCSAVCSRLLQELRRRQATSWFGIRFVYCARQ